MVMLRFSYQVCCQTDTHVGFVFRIFPEDSLKFSWPLFIMFYE
jgi:hypothetical protein